MIATSVTILVAAVLGVLAVRAIDKRRERDGKPLMSPLMSVCLVLLVCGACFGIYTWARPDSPVWTLAKTLKARIIPSPVGPQVAALTDVVPIIATPLIAMTAPIPCVECDIPEMMSHIQTGEPPF